MLNISFYGMRTIVFMKLKIFFKEFQYSIISPIISSFLFIMVIITINSFYKFNKNEDYLHFVIPGIIMMVIIQETYSNISETLIRMKQDGSFNDILISPISRLEISISFIIATVIIGFLVCFINLIFLNFFVNIYFDNFYRLCFYLLSISLIIGSIGSIIGFISYTWDTQQSFFSFFIAPISLFSGTFFSINYIDDELKNIFLFNPFYYIVTNFRESFLGNGSYNFNTDILIILLSFIFIYINLFIYKKGYKVIH